MAARNKSAWALAVALALALGGCFAETTPVEAPRRIIAPPKEPVLVPGSALEREHKRLIAAFGGEYRNTKIQKQLRAITERLRLVSDRPNEYFRVVLLNSGTVNAFALPNGYIYLTRGLLALANDSAEIASVLAHEIAHVTYRHAVARAELESRSQLVARVMSDVLNNPNGSQEARVQSRFTFASFSRQQELDADEGGVRAIAKAGFEAQGAVRFLRSLDRSSQLRRQAGADNDMLATHPGTAERLTQAIQLARQYGAPGVGEAERSKWLAAIEGLPIGEDPAVGIVKGRSYVNLRHKLALEAPEGFALDASPQALLGVSADQREALRLDFSRMDASRTLGQLLAQNPIEGLDIGQITENPINGIEAASGLARGKNWSFRVTLLRLGDNLYRLIFAAQNLTEAQDQRFQAAIATFRRLSEGAASARGEGRLRLVTATSAGPAADFVAAHMSGEPEALEIFGLLNALAPGEALVAGRSYKVVKP